MRKHKRNKINKIWMGWSNGKEVHLSPCVRRQVDDYGAKMIDYHIRLDEGYEIYYGSCFVARHECRLIEYEADHYWEQGEHLKALNEMMYAAMHALPDNEPEFEDVQWLSPTEMFYWHPNVKEFLRLSLRCREYCKNDTRLWPVFKGSWVERTHSKYLRVLGEWVNS
ncbi:MAG: hypothetical protein K6D59_03365 [Bacteroidales bacterium]|nr:hypothetical protein [Bacteroidales bacterium]